MGKKNTILHIGMPSEKQLDFFKATQRFIAYGGARGGGKSWAVRKKAILLASSHKDMKIMILRRSYPELRENHINPLKRELYNIATYKETEKSFAFPNRSRIIFGYCDEEGDVLRYQGQEYDVIFIDEATQLSEFQFNALCACVRGANDNPKRIYLTCNPGGVGHLWVKRLFIDREFANGENPDDYKFIFASVFDNKALLSMDKGYVTMLENLPYEMRRAWLDGDWDVLSGQYFSEWRRNIHVIKPFLIPEFWRRYFVMDYGLDMLAGYFIAMDQCGRAYVYREIYEKGLIISQAAEKIALAAGEEKVYEYIAPPDLWNRRQDTGKSVAEIFGDRGIFLSKASNDRVSGWMDLREWLKIYKDVTGKATANLKIFDNCSNLIKSIPSLLYDQKNPNDCATQPHTFTHGPDALRYFVAGRPYSTEKRMCLKEALPIELQEVKHNEQQYLEW